MERLADLPASPAVAELRDRVEVYQRTAASWLRSPPPEAQRGAMLKTVLDLNVEVIRLGGGPSKAPILDDDDDDIPRAVPLRPRTR